jgi:hypothetical protein
MCKTLVEVTHEARSKLKRFGTEAFWQTGLRTITIPGNVEMIEKKCFSSCRSLREVIFKGKVHEVAEDAFEECHLDCIKMPRGVRVSPSLSKLCRIEYMAVTKK